MKEKIQVHIADDHKILIEGIIAVINTGKYPVEFSFSTKYHLLFVSCMEDDTYISEAEGTAGTKLLGKGPVYKEKHFSPSVCKGCFGNNSVF